METVVNTVIILLGVVELGIFIFALCLLVQLRNKILERANIDMTIIDDLILKNGKMKMELDDTETKVLRLIKKQREELQLIDSKGNYYEINKLLKELISKKDKEIEQFYHD